MSNVQIFNVTGMSCASCSARVSSAVEKIPGVKNVNVNLLTGIMTVQGSVKSNTIIESVKKAGYGASVKSDSTLSFDNTETSGLVKRFISSVAILLVLMYFSMGHMLSFPLPSSLEHNFVCLSVIQGVLSFIILLINRKFFISGTLSLLHKSPNMDTLVSLGSGFSFIYSIYDFVVICINTSKQNLEVVQNSYSHLYFESAAMIVTLITLGKLLESVSKGKTTNALKALIKLTPKTAVVLKNGEQVEIPSAELKVGDEFIVKAGQNVPTDGIIISGNGSLDESSLTGESIPLEKSVNQQVFCSTTLTSGFITCKATKTVENTTFSQIISLVETASSSKAPIARIADKVSLVFVPAVLTLSFLTFGIWMIICKDFDFSLARGISVLVISCPCALGLATPVAIMVSNGVASKNGILFKTAESLETAGKINVACLDKTGTITQGKPFLTQIIPLENLSVQEILQIGASLESKSDHILATSIVNQCKKENLQLLSVTDFNVLNGIGISGKIENTEYLVVKEEFLSESVENNTKNQLLNQGKILTYLCKKQNENFIPLGIFVIEDKIKEDSKSAISLLNKMNVETVMLTGDNKITAEKIASECNISSVYAGILPNQKLDILNSFKNKKNVVCMIGDGINDSPALTCADIGVSIGNGSDIAIDSSQIILVKNSLLDFVNAVNLSKKTILNIKENLFWAFIYNVIGIPVAAGVFYNLNGLVLNPMICAACMSLSSFCVCMNALRLNLFKMKKSNEDFNICVKNDNMDSGENIMKKTINVDGMMCSHCEAHVQKALEAIEGIVSAKPNHETKTVDLELSKEVDDSVIAQAIQEAGYTVF